MKKYCLTLWIIACCNMLLPVVANTADLGSPIDLCVNCHDAETPGIVKQWQNSKHSMVGVKCYVCHMAQESGPAGSEHYGFQVTALVTLNSCEGCHPEQLQEFKERWDKVLRLIHGKRK